MYVLEIVVVKIFLPFYEAAAALGLTGQGGSHKAKCIHGVVACRKEIAKYSRAPSLLSLILVNEFLAEYLSVESQGMMRSNSSRRTDWQ